MRRYTITFKIIIDADSEVDALSQFSDEITKQELLNSIECVDFEELTPEQALQALIKLDREMNLY